MKVLVTGATGFLGKYIIAELAQHHYSITAFGRNQTIGKQLEETYLNVSFVQGDLCNSFDLEQALKGCDLVVHAGAKSTVWGKWDDFAAINITATNELLRLSALQQVRRFVFISSPSVYTKNFDQFQVTEEQYDPDNAINYYVKSKLLAEEIVQSYQAQMETVIVRPRGLFGIGDTSLVPRVLHLNDRIGIPLIKKGEQIVDLTCVENVAYAIRLCLESPAAVHQIYNISNGEPRSFKEVMNELFIALGKKPNYCYFSYRLLLNLARCLEWVYRIFKIEQEPIITVYTVYAASFSLTLSIVKAQDELGYQPIITISEGIKKYAKYNRVD